MIFKSALIGTIALLLALSAIVVVIPGSSANPVMNAGPGLLNAAFNGTVVINANGTLNNASAPLTHHGNYYNLTGNINGTIVIEHNDTIFNGQGHTLFYGPHGSPATYMVNISHTNSVSISNLNLNSTNAYFGIFTTYTNNDNFNNIVVTSTGISLFATNYSTNIKITNSVFNTSALLGPPGNVFLGLYFPNAFLPIPTSTASNFTVYNDSFSAHGVFADLLTGGANSSISNSHFKDYNEEGSLLVGGNNSTISNNLLTSTSESGAIDASPALGGSLNNITITGNSVTANETGLNYAAIQTRGNGSISGNSIYINATQVSVTGITSYSENTTLNGNSVNITNGGAPTNQIIGIQVTGSNNSVSSNNVEITGGSGIGLNLLGTGPVINYMKVTSNTIGITSADVTGIASPSSQFENSTISYNLLTLYGTLCQGIEFSGNYVSVSGNHIVVNQTDINGFDTSVLIGSASGGSYNNVLITDNVISETGLKGQLQLKAISLRGYNSNNVTVSSNNVDLKQLAESAYALSFSGTNNLTVSYNYVSMASSIEAVFIGQLSNAVLEGNSVTGNYGSTWYSAAVEVYTTSNVSILNNSFSNFNLSFSTNLVNGVTVAGNYVSNISQYILYSDADSNITFYHNNFVNYTGVIHPASTETNITFNTSFPMGGNYWDKYTGTDGNGDGIGDTPYVIGSGYSDNYPLMKKWTRPQAVFTETGLYSGTVWSVTFNGQTKTSSSSTIAFDILNATYQAYSYKINIVSGFKLVSQSSGTESYSGNGSQTNVQYNPPLEFTLLETGLPSSTSWIITINGTSHTVTGNNYTITAYKGTEFSFTISNTSLYYSSVLAGSYTLNDTNKTVDVVFTHYSYITGIMPASGYSLYVNGVRENLSSGAFNLTLTAGSYEIVVKDSSGSIYDNVTLQPGQSVNVTSLFKQSSAGLPIQDLYYAGGAIGAVALVGGVATLLRRRNMGK